MGRMERGEGVLGRIAKGLGVVGRARVAVEGRTGTSIEGRIKPVKKRIRDGCYAAE